MSGATVETTLIRPLSAWVAEHVLTKDPAPACYGLRQRFIAPDGSTQSRDGFFALLHLEDYEKRIVRPHERTLAGPKADRLKLIRAARANLSVVFLLYEDRDDALAGRFDAALEKPIASASDAVGSTRLGRVDDQRDEPLAAHRPRDDHRQPPEPRRAVRRLQLGRAAG